MKLKAFKHTYREYDVEARLEVVKSYEETFKEHFNRKSKKINNDIENYNLLKARRGLYKLDNDKEWTFYWRDTLSMCGGFLGFVTYFMGIAMYTKYKAENSQELADRLREYASSQGFDDYHQFIEEVEANLTKRISGGLFHHRIEYIYSSPEYQNWFNNIEIIKDDVYRNVQESVEQTFFSAGAIVLVTALCCAPYIVTRLQKRHYDKLIEKMEQNLSDKEKEKGIEHSRRVEPYQIKVESEMTGYEKYCNMRKRERARRAIGGARVDYSDDEYER